MSEPTFIDFNIQELGNNFDLEMYGKKSIHLYTDIGKFVIKNSALTQFLHLLGLKKKDLKQLGEKAIDEIKKRILETGNIVLSTLEIDNGVYYVYRVTTEQYVPIPHRILFDFAKDVLSEMGVNVEPKVVRYTKRTVAYFPLFRRPLRYAREGDALTIYLAVSNANTGRHSIKIYGYGEILACSNGLIDNEIVSRIRIYHTKDIKAILQRVGEAIKEVFEKLKTKYEVIARRIEELQTIELEDWLIEKWLELKLKQLPKKYHKWFVKVLYNNIDEFGETAEALFQTLTYFVSRLAKRNEDLSQRLNSEVNKLLKNPELYIQAIVK